MRLYPERDAEILRQRDSGMTYRAIAKHHGLCAERIGQIIWRGKRERGDEMPAFKPRRPKPLTEEEQRIRDERTAAWVQFVFNQPPIDNSHIQFPPCPLCNGTGRYDGEPCPDCKGKGS